MVYEKNYKGLPALERPKISKKVQEKEDEIKKLYEANKWWNDRILQLNWNKLEWVNPRTLTKRNKPFSVSSKRFDFKKGDRMSHWVVHSKLKRIRYH